MKLPDSVSPGSLPDDVKFPSSLPDSILSPGHLPDDYSEAELSKFSEMYKKYCKDSARSLEYNSLSSKVYNLECENQELRNRIAILEDELMRYKTELGSVYQGE